MLGPIVCGILGFVLSINGIGYKNPIFYLVIVPVAILIPILENRK